MTQPTIAFIGAGHMGSSLIAGLLQDGFPAAHIWATGRKPDHLAKLKTFGIHVTDNNVEAVQAADIVVLAIKPNIVAQVCQQIAAAVQQKKALVVSIAASVPTAVLKQQLGDAAIVRTMPNMPAMVGCGATGLYAEDNVTEAQRDQAESILRAVGLTTWVDQEAQLDAVTAVSGSGPAYFFLVMEAMQKAGVKLGLDPAMAKLLTIQTALGTAKLALESDLELSALRKQVTSKGGTTEAALSILEPNEMLSRFESALAAAAKRAKSL